MPDLLSSTFEHLAKSPNKSATEVLVHALSVPMPGVELLATRAILQTVSTRGHFELVRRFHELGEEAGRLVLAEHRRIEAALRHALQHGERQALQNSLEIISASGSYGMLPLLLGSAAEAEPGVREQLLLAITRMVNSAYELLYADESGRRRTTGRAQAEAICRQVLLDLDQACTHRFENHPPDALLEATLILGGADSAAVRKLLWQAPQECRARAADQLLTSLHPGVLRLICDGLGMNYPHPKMLEAVGTRCDMPFIVYLLRWLPQRLNPVQQKNLRQVEHIAWLSSYRDELSMIPSGLQPNLVRLIAATGIHSDSKRELQEWLLRHGGPEGREAATESLGLLNSESVRTIVTEELHSDVPQDQAWAVRRIREVDHPDAFSVLVGQLDSPHEIVREAARRELQGFNVERLLELSDSMDPLAAARAGMLLRKTDPQFALKLSRELASPVHRRRIRAAYGALRMGLHLEVIPALLVLLEDPDPIIRRAGVEVLATVEQPVVRKAISALAHDSSPRVREVVETALGSPTAETVSQVEWPSEHGG